MVAGMSVTDTSSAGCERCVMNLRLPYPPSVNNYLMHTPRGTFRTKAANAYRSVVAGLVVQELHMQPMLSGRLAVSIELTMPDRRKRDIDNAQKCLLDSLQAAGVFRDDSQIDFLQIRRLHVEPPGAADVCIEVIETEGE